MSDDKDTQLALCQLGRVLEETRGMDRRAFLGRLGQMAAGSALLTTFARLLGTGRATAAEKPVTTMGWGGAWKEAMFKAYFTPWTKKTGIPVRYVTPYSFSKVRAMHEAGHQELDVFEAGAFESPRLIKLGMAAPLDFNVIDKSALSPRQLKYPNAIGSITLSTVLVYNKKKWPGEHHPKSWADFWDVKKFPGPRCLRRRCYTMMEAALMADGVPTDPKKIYPIDVDRALKKLDEIRPHVRVWWTSGAQQQQVIQDEEVDLIAMWNGRASDSILNKGANYEIVWNQALYQGEVESWFLLKGAPNPEGGMKLLDFVGRAEPQATFARALFYGPTNLKAYDYIDSKLAKQLPSYPDNEKVSFELDMEYWVENIDELTRRFEEWIQA